jgi:hypothetical protein
MPYRPHGKALVDPYSPRAFAICQRCGTLYNSYKLSFQYQWMGTKLQNKWVRVCPDCTDIPSIFLRQIIIPPDPYPTIQPRTEPYAIDEAGGRDMPVYISGAVALAQLVAPGWATGFWSSAIGAGGSGSTLNGSYPNMGGGGGAYAQTNAVPITKNQIVYYSIGAGGSAGSDGQDSWVSTTNVAPLSTAQGCLAKAGLGGFPVLNPTGGPGGAAASCLGDITFSGGNGGTAAIGPGCCGGTGGGGAAGPYGAGQNGGNTTAGNTASSGGGSDGTRGTGTGGQGGANLNPGQPGRADGAYAQSGGAGGGGGGGAGDPAAANGGIGGIGASYGGGGGGGGYAAGVNGPGSAGGPGFVVIRWLTL